MPVIGATEPASTVKPRYIPGNLGYGRPSCTQNFHVTMGMRRAVSKQPPKTPTATFSLGVNDGRRLSDTVREKATPFAGASGAAAATGILDEPLDEKTSS